MALMPPKKKKNISKPSQMDGLNHLCHDGDDWGMICHHRRCALYEVIVRGTLSATAKVSATLDGPLRGIFDGMEIWGMPRALVWWNKLVFFMVNLCRLILSYTIISWFWPFSAGVLKALKKEALVFWCVIWISWRVPLGCLQVLPLDGLLWRRAGWLSRTCRISWYFMCIKRWRVACWTWEEFHHEKEDWPISRS